MFESLATPVPCRYMQSRLCFAVVTDLLGVLGPVPPHPLFTFFNLCLWLWDIVSVSELAGVIVIVGAIRDPYASLSDYPCVLRSYCWLAYRIDHCVPGFSMESNSIPHALTM